MTFWDFSSSLASLITSLMRVQIAQSKILKASKLLSIELFLANMDRNSCHTGAQYSLSVAIVFSNQVLLKTWYELRDTQSCTAT